MQSTTQHTAKIIPLEAVPSKQRFTRRIGATTYRVSVHFSPDSKETVNDKIMRMIRNESSGKAVKQ